ncbi:hypothetical protein GYA93_22310 [Gordonia desulfuricans]|uniref:Uncharacterized protein n=1 Tax=Gordonia desulfuricans TaxID=89051 RepID=A0A7K3LVF6_9ACTN|nr:hypothetical protein [Gordonia desulfuricans]NDK92270.1 hypothetical protein [Gordonia desulfuricans]
MQTSVGGRGGGPDDPVDELAQVAARRRQLARDEEVAVRRARIAGLSWAEIGVVLGVTKQAMHKKYRQVG